VARRRVPAYEVVGVSKHIECVLERADNPEEAHRKAGEWAPRFPGNLINVIVRPTESPEGGPWEVGRGGA
jgi:hypothetical protein